jgi:hypothetical protein
MQRPCTSISIQKFIFIGWNSSQTEYYAMLIPKLRTYEELKPLNQLIKEFGPFKSLEDCKRDI